MLRASGDVGSQEGVGNIMVILFRLCVLFSFLMKRKEGRWHTTIHICIASRATVLRHTFLEREG
jgi:hypothetical protein